MTDTHRKELHRPTRDLPWSRTAAGTPSQVPCTEENLSGHSAHPRVTCTEQIQNLPSKAEHLTFKNQTVADFHTDLPDEKINAL